MATTIESIRRKAQRLDAGWPVLFISVLVLSLGSTVSKKAATPGLTLACIRSIIACLAWQIILAFRGKRITWFAMKAALLPGAMFGVNIACFFTAVQHTHVANAEFIGALGPLVVVPSGAIFYRERIPWRALVWGVPAMGGVAMVALLSAKNKGGESNVFGIVMAIASVFTWAGYLLLAKKFRPRVDIGEFMACASLAAAVILLPFSISQGFVSAVPARGWPWLIILAFSNGVIAHTLILVAQKHLALGTISTVQVSQPALAAMAAWLILGEAIRPVQFVGMAVVIVSLVLYSLTVQRAAFPWQRRTDARP